MLSDANFDPKFLKNDDFWWTATNFQNPWNPCNQGVTGLYETRQNQRHNNRMLELFKCVCRKYIYLYPEMVTSEIYTYKSMYEEAGNDLTGANFAHVDGNGENHWYWYIQKI